MLGLNGETKIIPSIKVRPVDTTGAGDAFVGAVLLSISRKDINRNSIVANEMNGSKIITNGNKAGARTCEYMGAMEAFKHLSSDIFS